jgi:hypothetical protein
MAAALDRFVPRFAAEPPQDLLPYGRWAVRLREEFLAACLAIDAGEEDLGEPEAVVWFPDRTWGGRTYVPATAATTTGFELFGYVSYEPPADGAEPAGFAARADFTSETAAQNPDWKLDLSDEVVGVWRGEDAARAEMTLVWGLPMVPGGALAAAELGGVVVDRSPLLEDRFTLLAPDAYRTDYLEVALLDGRGSELARESLYEED